MSSILAVFIGVLLIGLIVNRRAVQRIFSAGQAQVGKLGRMAANADPMAQYLEAVDQAADDICEAKHSYEKSAAQIRSLQRNKSEISQDIQRLTNRIQNAVNSGDTPAAERYAAQLASKEDDLKLVTMNLQAAESIHGRFSRQMEVATQRVRESKEKAKSLGLKLELSKRSKEMVDYAKSFNGSLNTETLDSLEDKVESAIDQNLAAVDVAAEFDEPDMRDTDRSAATKSVLDRFTKTA